MLSLLLAGAPPPSSANLQELQRTWPSNCVNVPTRVQPPPAVPQTLAGDLSCLQSNTKPPVVWLPEPPTPSPGHLLPLQHQDARHSSPKLTCTPHLCNSALQSLHLRHPPCLLAAFTWVFLLLHSCENPSLPLPFPLSGHLHSPLHGRVIDEPLSPSKGLWATQE